MKRTTRSRIFYFAPISTDTVNRRYGQHLHVGAAANKVLGVCRAMRAGGRTPVIVSALLPSRLGDVFKRQEFVRTNGVGFAKVYGWGRGAVKRVVSGLALLGFAIRRVRSHDRVLIYNFFPEFIPVALYQRLIGNPAFLDIEDSPRFDQEGPWSIVHRVSFAIMLALCRRRYVIVSQHLGRQLGLSEFHPVYGVSSYFSQGATTRTAFSDETVKVIYGGAIMPPTGSTLFVDAVRLLAQQHPDLPLHFHVTGLFPEAEFRALEREINAKGRIRMTAHADLSAADYRKLAGEMDIGLCLKLPDSGMGQTTFPSKVIEIAAMGMLLCSTAVSDVPIIFDRENAIVLKTDNPRELADELRMATLDRAGSARRAEAGRQLVVDRYSESVVGLNLIKFLDGSV